MQRTRDPQIYRHALIPPAQGGTCASLRKTIVLANLEMCLQRTLSTQWMLARTPVAKEYPRISWVMKGTRKHARRTRSSLSESNPSGSER